jgi:ERCC4-type nuclease
MLHNIFKKSKKRKTKNLSKTQILPNIIIDIHEKNSLVPANLSELNIQTIFKSLKIGDYIINKIIIERKTFSDLISSMLNKRLLEQLHQLKQTQNTHTPILLIEGEHNLPPNSNIHPNSYKGLILSILTQYQIPIIQTKSPKETAQYLSLLAKQQLKSQIPISPHSRIPKTIPQQKQYILESFPNIGPQTAKKLLKKFKTLTNIFQAKPNNLNEILKSKTPQFQDILNSKK